MFNSSMTKEGSTSMYEAAARLPELTSIRFVSDHGFVAVVQFCKVLKEGGGGRKLNDIDFNSSEVKDEAGNALIDAIENGHLPALTYLSIFDYDESRFMSRDVHTKLQSLCQRRDIGFTGQYDR
mmetsp:Transcript_113770/g.284584  ORF Transcript_113770/g.284584 Transcript_113770/m.284584 type:complete len:124 (+) Transcript_113770:3-374(+)